MIGRDYYGNIYGCSTSGVVKGGSCGGFAGSIEGSEIENCNSVSDVNGGGYTAGGFIYWSSSGSIKNCFAAGSVKGDPAGGFVVSNGRRCIIEESYAAGSVTCKRESGGGFVGYNDGIINNCYAWGDVICSSYGYGSLGGFVGSGYEGRIENCYAKGKVTGNQNNTIGGFSGNYYYISDCFWDKETSLQNTSCGSAIGKTKAGMKTKSTFTSAGWDFMGESVNGPNDVWRMCKDGVDYPRLSWEHSSHGDFDCPDGTDFYDLKILADNWLMKEEHINFLDFSVFANEWHGDMKSLFDFVNQWLMPVNDIADIAPGPGGDGTINMLDFAELADYWISK